MVVALQGSTGTAGRPFEVVLKEKRACRQMRSQAAGTPKLQRRRGERGEERRREERRGGEVILGSECVVMSGAETRGSSAGERGRGRAESARERGQARES